MYRAAALTWSHSKSLIQCSQCSCGPSSTSEYLGCSPCEIIMVISHDISYYYEDGYLPTIKLHFVSPKVK